ncbi:MAG: diphthine--ammonia ligase [Candidatus Marsarchaeota archaeon]|nr:diphthine--ammonia ligase [Candidatus Marsarchaeota archaeon]
MGIVFCWSGGKDSALALNYLLQNGYKVDTLLTTITKDYDRISIHGVRRSLLKMQAEAIGIPLEEIFLSKDSSNEDYESKMCDKLKELKRNGATHVGYGDIFLEWLKRKRESLAKSAGVKCVFPLWGMSTSELANSFIGNGFKAVFTCVDSKVLDKNWAGREFDIEALEDFPQNVDPCGENGEFHTFVYDGPIFNKRIEITKGEVVLREDRFYYCDILPK